MGHFGLGLMEFSDWASLGLLYGLKLAFISGLLILGLKVSWAGSKQLKDWLDPTQMDQLSPQAATTTTSRPNLHVSANSRCQEPLLRWPSSPSASLSISLFLFTVCLLLCCLASFLKMSYVCLPFPFCMYFCNLLFLFRM